VPSVPDVGLALTEADLCLADLPDFLAREEYRWPDRGEQDEPPLGDIEGMAGQFVTEGDFDLDYDDFLLYAFLTDSLFAAELLWEHPKNHEFGGLYRVHDYQYPLWRTEDIYAIYACARAVGKTESIKGDAFSHTFKRLGENMLVTAPELIHLKPLTDAIEERIRDTRLTREFLDLRGGKTGFTHMPFGVDYIDGTKIVGRIPRREGTGVKGQHQPDLRVEEAQDYPKRGWDEVHETVNKGGIRWDGQPDFTYWAYGVHSGARDSGFYSRTDNFKLVTITKLQTVEWNKAEKAAAVAAYGGSNAPDYRRNILGEAGAPASPYFVMSRLMASIDQNDESEYNQHQYVAQQIHAEEIEEMDMEMADILDLPMEFGPVYAGMDVGLTISPTVIVLFSKEKIEGRERLKMIRMYHLWRLRPKQIRQTLYALTYHLGKKLIAFGMDVTGLGFPMFQEMEDDEAAPQHLLNVSRGYFFNAQVPVGVNKDFITEDDRGNMRDQYGSAVKVEKDPLSGEERFVSTMPMIEASTRYVRDWIDTGRLLLPFDQDVRGDMQGETHQRVKSVGEKKGKKPNSFHILDAMRAAAMAEKAETIEEAIANTEQEEVLDMVG
jgi:hypothetical protein